MNDLQMLLHGPLGTVIIVLGVLWSILMFFAPFFWFGTNSRTKEIANRLKETNEKLDRLVELIGGDEDRKASSVGVPEMPSGRGQMRKEPRIS